MRRASTRDLDQVASTLAAAFETDPVFSWLIPPSVRNRPARLHRMFRAISAGYLRKSDHCFLLEEGQAVALWTEPGSWEVPPGDILSELGDYLGALRHRAAHAVAALTGVERAHPKQPHHWYLAYLGTRPEHRSNGLGSQLLRHVLDGADLAGMPAYLESSNPRNLTLYQRHGFEVVEEMKLPLGAPPIYRMWREPRPD